MAKESPDDAEDPRIPRIEITSLNDNTDFDFFPHLKGNQKGDHGKVIDSLKQGTYNPYMGALEYKGEFDLKEKKFTASLISNDVIASPKDGVFSANIESDRIEQLKELHDTKIPLRRRYFANPRQYYDHILLADGYTNTFAGTVIDTWVDFTIPRELKPVLKLRHPSGDKEADMKKIKSHADVIQKLINIDRWYSDNGPKKTDPYFDITLQQKFKAAFKLREVFGRNAIVKEKWEDYDPVTVGKEEFKTLPNVLKLLSSLDMGITEIELYTGKVAGVWISNDQPYIPAENMMYFVNEYGTPQIGAMSYGFSKLQRSIDQVRLYRRIMAKNLPQFLRTAANGMGAFVMNTTGYDDTTRKKIRTEIKNSWRSGEISVIDYANVDNFEFKEFKINSDIEALVKLEQALLMTIANVIGVPQSIILDAGSPARATLIGRMLSFINNNVAQARTTFGQQLANQWYMPNLRVVADKNLLEEIYVDVEFEDVSLETKQEKIDRLLQETQLNPYTDEYIGEELEDKDYISHIDLKKRKEQQEMSKMNPGAGGSGKSKPETFSVRDHGTGEKKTMTSS